MVNKDLIISRCEFIFLSSIPIVFIASSNLFDFSCKLFFNWFTSTTDDVINPPVDFIESSNAALSSPGCQAGDLKIFLVELLSIVLLSSVLSFSRTSAAILSVSAASFLRSSMEFKSLLSNSICTIGGGVGGGVGGGKIIVSSSLLLFLSSFLLSLLSLLRTLSPSSLSTGLSCLRKFPSDIRLRRAKMAANSLIVWLLFGLFICINLFLCFL